MRKWTERPLFQYLAVVLSLLLIINLIPPTAFRTSAEEEDYVGTVTLKYEKDGQTCYPEFNGTATLTNPNDIEDTHSANVGQGKIVFHEIRYGVVYQLSVSLSETGDYLYDANGGSFVNSSAFADFVVFDEEDPKAEAALTAAAETYSCQGIVEGGDPEREIQVKVTEINGYTLKEPVTAVATETGGGYTLTGLPEITGAVMKLSYSSEGFQTVTKEAAYPAAGETLETVTLVPETYEISAACGENGRIALNGDDTIDSYTASYNDSVQVTVTPDTDYVIREVLVDGQPKKVTDKKGFTFTISGIRRDYSVSASFEVLVDSKCAVAFTVGENGQIAFDGSLITNSDGRTQFEVNCLETVSYMVTPYNDYYISEVCVNGAAKTLTDAQKLLLSDEISDISADTEITVSFAEKVDVAKPVISDIDQSQLTVTDYRADGYGPATATRFRLNVNDAASAGVTETKSGASKLYYAVGEYDSVAAMVSATEIAVSDGQTVSIDVSAGTTVSFILCDLAGNESAPHVVSFVQDVQAPYLTGAGLYTDPDCTDNDGIKLSDKGYVYGNTMYLKLTASDDLTGVKSAEFFYADEATGNYVSLGSVNRSADGSFVCALTKDKFPDYRRITGKLTDEFGNESDYLSLVGMNLLSKDYVAIGEGYVTASVSYNGSNVHSGSIYRDAKFLVTFTDFFGDGITNVNISVNGTPVSADANGTAIAPGSTYVSGIGFLLDESVGGNLFVEGTNEIVVSAQNLYGGKLNNGGETYSYTFSLDTTAPEVTGIAVYSGSAVTPDRFGDGAIYANAPFDITVTANDGINGSGIAKITLYDGDVEIASFTGNYSEASEDDYPRFTVPGAAFAEKQGELNLSVVVTDKVGNVSEKIVPNASFAVKSGKVYYATESTADIIIAENETASASGWYADAPDLKVQMQNVFSGISEYEVKCGTQVIASGSFDSIPEQKDSYELVIPGSEIGADTSGTYTVTVKVTDRTGNVATEDFTFEIDTDEPEITAFEVQAATETLLSSYSFGTFVNGAISVKVTASDKPATCSGLYSISLYANDTLIGTTQTEGQQDVTFDITKDVLASFGTDVIVLKAYATDIAGNTGTLTEMTAGMTNLSVAGLFFSDRAGTITTKHDVTNQYVDGEKVWVPSDTTYSVAVENPISGIRHITVTCNGVAVTLDQNGDALPDPIFTDLSETKYQIDFNLADMGTPDAMDGSLKIVIEAEDFAGNKSTKEDIFYIDSESPVVTGYEITPVDTMNPLNFLKFGTFTNGKVKVTISVDDGSISSGLKTIALTIDANTPLVLPVENGKAVFELPQSALSENFVQEMILSAVVTDNVGNVSIAAGPTNMTPAGDSDVLVVENVKPLIQVTRDSGTESPRTMTEGSEQKDWYSGEVIWNIEITDSNAGIGSYEILLNDTVLSEDADLKAIIGDNTALDSKVTSETFRISTNQAAINSDCSFKLTVKAKDNAGNEAEVYEDVIYSDAIAPQIDGFEVTKKNADTTFLNADYGVFANGPLQVTVHAEDASATDPASGVAEITLYVNDEVFETGKVTDGSGSYTFVVPASELASPSSSTIALKAEVKDASGLTGACVALNTTNSNLLSSYIVLENKAPKITITTPDTGKHVIDGKNWYTSEFDFSVQVDESDSAIDTIKVTVNGKDLTEEHSGDAIPANYRNPGGEQVKTTKLDFNTGDFASANFTYVIHITATDQAGNRTETEETYYLDTANPKVEGFTVTNVEANDVLTYRPYGTYTNGKLSITVSVSDAELSSGYNRISLLVNGTTYESSVTDGKATFIVPNAGIAAGSAVSYKLQATVSDRCGRVSDVLALDHNGYPTMQNDSVLVEKNLPKIQGTVDGQNLYSSNGKRWYSSDADWTITVSDADSGVGTVQVTINGKAVTTKKDGTALKGDYSKDAAATLTDTFTVTTKGIDPASDGSYQIAVTVTDNAGNVSAVYQDTVYKDTAAPAISKFRFSTEGFVEGSEEESGVKITDYGFYFTKDATVHISASDAAPSCGVKTITYYLHDLITGDTTPVTQAVDANNEISVVIKSPFKGQIYAKASDNVTNGGGYVTPKSAIVENDDNHDAEKHIIVSKPETQYRQANGVELYSSDLDFGLTIVDRYSGIRSIEWSVEAPYDANKNFVGTLTVGNDGSISGDTDGWTKKDTDSNLVTEISKVLHITHDSNDIVIRVKMTDRAGNETSDEFTVGIDKTAPTVEFSYDVNAGDEDNPNYFNVPRVMTIVVTERNFSPTDFVTNIKNTDGKVPAISAWTDNRDAQNPNRTTHTATISFHDDGHFSGGLSYTDRAGNTSNNPAVPLFVIDQTTPVISVVYDNNDVRNGKFYNKERNATVTITERNFDVARVTISGNVTQIGNWTANGDRHVVVVSFTNENTYEMSIKATDRAGNVAIPYTEEPFIIDLTAPEVFLSGVKDANQKEVTPTITISDQNFSAKDVQVSIKDLDGQEIKNEFTTEEISGLSYTGIKYVYSDFEELPENDGIYRLKVTAVDLAGNESTPIDKTFSVNRFGSTYDLSDLKSINGQYLKGARDLTFTEINIDEINQDSVVINVVRNGVPTALTQDRDYRIEKINTQNKERSEYRYTILSSAFDKDGEYVVSVSSVDKAGNINENYKQDKGGKINFCIDNVAPNIIVLEPAENTTYAQTSLQASVDVKDNYSLRDVHIFLNDKEISYVNDGDRYTFLLNESDTAMNIRVVATDGAGNESVTEIKNVLVSTNMFARFLNNTGAVVGTSVGVLGVLGAILLILLRKRKKNA